MGLFDVFGNSRKKAEEEERILEERQEKQREETIAAQREAHKNLHWPTVPRVNRMNVKDASAALIVEDPITPERKDEIGALIYEPKLATDNVKDLNLQELMFLLVTHLLYNREAALTNYESNHRVIYNDLLRRIHEAPEFYVIFDRKSGYPLVDGGCINVYLDKEHAEKASAIYNAQFRDTAVVARPGETAEPLENGRKPIALFDYLYYLGTENIMIDNGWYKSPIKRSEISAPIGFNADPAKTPPANPALSYAMTDFVQEVAWPVKYEKRDEIIKQKQNRMFTMLPTAKFLIPTTVAEQEVTAADGTKGKKQEVKFPVLNMKDKKFLPVFTDLFEYSKNRKTDDGSKPAAFEYKNLVRLLSGVDGILINCNGQKVIIGKDKLVELVQPKA